MGISLHFQHLCLRLCATGPPTFRYGQWVRQTKETQTILVTVKSTWKGFLRIRTEVALPPDKALQGFQSLAKHTTDNNKHYRGGKNLHHPTIRAD